MENGPRPRRSGFSITTGASKFENSIRIFRANSKVASDHATSKTESKDNATGGIYQQLLLINTFIRQIKLMKNSH